MSNKPKILIISSIGQPPFLGGIENVLETILTSDIKKYFSFSVFDTYRTPDHKRTSLHKLCYAISLPFLCASFILKDRPDVAHIHFCSKVDFWKHSICMLTCRFCNVKILFHLHGGSFDSVYYNYPLWKKSLVKYILKRADFIAVLSEYWKGFITNLTQKDGNILILPNPVNCEAISKYCTVEDTSPLNNSVLLIGSLGLRKGHYDALKAIPFVIDNNPKVTFLFAGTEEDAGASLKLKNIAQQHNIQEHVSLLGPVTGEDKLRLISDAGIIILPSFGENMPISILEGMAAWKPIIATNVGGIPELIKNNVDGILIDAGDWHALADKINYLFKNPTKARKLGKQAGNSARKNWDILIVVKKYADVYNTIIHQL